MAFLAAAALNLLVLSPDFWNHFQFKSAVAWTPILTFAFGSKSTIFKRNKDLFIYFYIGCAT